MNIWINDSKAAFHNQSLLLDKEHMDFGPQDFGLPGKNWLVFCL